MPANIAPVNNSNNETAKPISTPPANAKIAKAILLRQNDNAGVQ
jgi:hypothetical protein